VHLDVIRKVQSFQGLACMARLTTVRLVARLLHAFRSMRFLIAVTRWRFATVAAVLGQAGLSFPQRFPLVGQLLGKLFSLDGHITKQVSNRTLAFFKSNMDFFICGHVKVHETDHKPNRLCFATIVEAEQLQA
jgi:hypothetical protein